MLFQRTVSTGAQGGEQSRTTSTIVQKDSKKMNAAPSETEGRRFAVGGAMMVSHRCSHP